MRSVQDRGERGVSTPRLKRPVVEPGDSHPPLARRGFTLIELLVVITIIAVLVSLLLAGVFKALATAQVVHNRNDITQLSAAITLFKQTFRVDYLPSYIQNGDPYLSRLYSQAPPTWLPQTYQGSQCLIFFLGGVNGEGFSSDPTNPMKPPYPGEQRLGPFSDFKKVSAPQAWPGYLGDVYKHPFAYFSTIGPSNSYGMNGANGQENAAIGCPAPYLEAIGSTYLMPDSFQLISAGPNNRFNPGNRWPGVTGVGMDDLSNFATGPLGSGQ